MYQNLILSLAAWLYYWSEALLNYSHNLYRKAGKCLDHAEKLKREDGK